MKIANLKSLLKNIREKFQFLRQFFIDRHEINSDYSFYKRYLCKRNSICITKINNFYIWIYVFLLKSFNAFSVMYVFGIMRDIDTSNLCKYTDILEKLKLKIIML